MEITLWITYMCNLKCAYCYEGNEKKKLHMTMETAKSAITFISGKIDKMKKGSKMNIVLHGGEPLLNYSVLIYIIMNLKQFKIDNKDKVEIAISLTTNGTLLDEEKLEELLQVIDYIAISIDGEKESHNCNRVFCNGEGSFDIVEKNAKKALIINSDIMARMTITPQTVQEFCKNVKYLHQLGFIHIASAINQYDHNWTKKHKEILVDEIKKLADFQIECEREGDKVHLSVVQEMEFRRKSFCMGGEQTIHISSEGDLYPCSHVVGRKEFKIGSLKEGIVQEKLDKIKEINRKEVLKCKGCKWSEICYGVRCKLINYAITGDYYTPSPATCMNEYCLLQGYEHYRNSRTM